MKEETAVVAVKTRNRTQVTTETEASAGIEISRGVMLATTTAAATVGLWTAACFVGALISAGPVGMIKGWFSAVAGF